MADQQPTSPADEQVPVCPRHPDRESYVRCQRCGRPTCPECQRPAAVGIQCVDCVREGSKSVRQGRTVFGGAVTDGRPLVTFGVIGLCAAVFVLQTVVPGITRDISFIPALGGAEPWRFITSAFAHDGFLHIAFNMYALWIMGQYLEPLLGHLRFAALYLLSALGGSVVFLLFAAPRPEATTFQECGLWCTSAVGASGAVFGLFGAFLILQRSLNRSAAGMYVIIGLNAVLGFVIPNIAWQDHLGGLLTGLGIGAIIGYLGRGRPQGMLGERRRLAWVHWAAMGVLLVVLVTVTVLRYATVGA